eukprot:1476456-Rhodomonas_salina.1
MRRRTTPRFWKRSSSARATARSLLGSRCCCCFVSERYAACSSLLTCALLWRRTAAPTPDSVSPAANSVSSADSLASWEVKRWGPGVPFALAVS